MFKLLGKIFGDKKTSEKIIDATIGGVDSLFTTKEEKIDAINRHLETMQPFKLVQRLLVLSISFTVLFLLLVCVGFVIAQGYGFSNGLVIVKGITELVVDWNIGYAFTAIITVYITGGVLKMKK